MGPEAAGAARRARWASPLRWRRRAARYGRVWSDGLALVIPGGPEAPSEARSAVGVIGRDLGERLLESLRLLVTELVTNSVSHGGAGAEDTLRLEVSLSPEAVRVEVSDLGPGFEPASVKSDESPRTGWGLVLVERVSDRWGVRQRGRCVWFEMDR